MINGTNQIERRKSVTEIQHAKDKRKVHFSE